MAKFNVDGVQNVEVSQKIPSEKTLEEQLELMEEYTRAHQDGAVLSKGMRELLCLHVLYPALFREIEERDLFIGRIDTLPIGFGCVTSLGGVGHYCVFSKLRQFQRQLTEDSQKTRAETLYQYWLDHDLKTLYNYVEPQFTLRLDKDTPDDIWEGALDALEAGATYPTYGSINTSDALWAIKDLVYQKKKYSLAELHKAALANFEGDEALRKELWNCDKYGNDLDTADSMANELYEYIAKGIRNRGIKAGMQYFLIVLSNNQMNTEWGRTTGASLDGRHKGRYMNLANNPQGGANVSGPTAMLNSLAKFNPIYHAGSVQNIKFSLEFFRENRNIILALFKTYFFKKGGCHLMVTVISKGALEDAVLHPEDYPDLLVRVSGFSAIFIKLDADVQQELISRVPYE